METKLTLDNYHEMLALHRAIMEIKFVSKPNDPAVFGSSHLANVAHRNLDAMIQYEKFKYGQSNWESLRTLTKDSVVWGLIIRQVQFQSNWKKLSEAIKKQLVKNLASPMIISDDLIQQVITEANVCEI